MGNTDYSDESPTLVTFASWEDRFQQGVTKLIRESNPGRVIVFFFHEYAEWSAAHRAAVNDACRSNGNTHVAVEMRVASPAENWWAMWRAFTECVREKSRVIVDISTMPREVIWNALWLLERREAAIEYVYSRPESYGKWLSRDPQQPRLVFKMSGICRLGLRTALVVLSGTDTERTQQLMQFFEPAVTFLGLQKPRKAASADRIKIHATQFRRQRGVECFEVDAFSADHGQAVVEGMVRPLSTEFNVILSSLGPKVTAIALYNIHRTNDMLGIAYAPSREFNREYSKGLADTIRGSIRQLSGKSGQIYSGPR